ncbi:MarR family transcriptional regulator [Vibrio profundum]|uniref:MarR family winged helix-turn-helix transcriptional regulator n=1 Tax=Vibrio profundum TaxID=2910247 RepID=UPI003D0DDBB7
MIEKKRDVKLSRPESFGWLVAVLGSQMASALDKKLKEMNLNLGLWPTLFALWEEEGLTQADLAVRCQTENYTTTRVIDSLEKLELVERKKHPTSRRAYQVFLTDKGHALEEEATTAAITCNDEFLSVLSETEKKQINELLVKIISGRNGSIIPRIE